MGSADTTKILSKLKEFNTNATGDGLHLSNDQLQQIEELANGNTTNLDAKLQLLFQTFKWPVGTSSFVCLSVCSTLSVV